jgi:hypothetical protein
LEEVALYMVNVAEGSQADEDATCSPSKFTTIQPRVGSTEDSFSVKPEVIGDKSVSAKEVAFDMLFRQKDDDVAALTGALCLRIIAANSEGSTVVKRHVLLSSVSLRYSRSEEKRALVINGMPIPPGQQIVRDVRPPIRGRLFSPLL